MRELIRAAVEELAKRNGDFDSDWWLTEALGKGGLFIEKNFAEFSNAPLLEMDYAIFLQALRLGYIGEGSKAELTENKHREKLVDATSAWWASVPRAYRSTFPIPGALENLFGIAPVSVGGGIALFGSVQPPASVPLNSLTNLGDLFVPKAGDAAGPSLAIESSGFVLRQDWLEPTAAAAFRTCKVVIILAEVLGVFTRTSSRSNPVTVATLFDVADKTTHQVQLPAGFGTTLSRIAMHKSVIEAQQTITSPAHTRTPVEVRDYLQARLKRVGAAIEGARAHVTWKAKGGETNEQKAQAANNEHRARIVTAAEWLFDASCESAPAMAYVQLAIGFEALYGGEDRDSITYSLSNRLAYALGGSGAERKELRDKFVDFYKQRSKIVHNGSLRLMAEERQLYQWGDETLRRALVHELELVAGVPRGLGA